MRLRVTGIQIRRKTERAPRMTAETAANRCRCADEFDLILASRDAAQIAAAVAAFKAWDAAGRPDVPSIIRWQAESGGA